MAGCTHKALAGTSVVAGMAAAGAAIRAKAIGRRVEATHATPFLLWDGLTEQSVDVGVARIELPIRYWRTDCFMGLFPADPDAVRRLLPSERLHPMLLPHGAAAVAVVAYNYIETGVGPYGEVGISPLCTLDRAAPPVVSLLQGYRRGFAGFVAHLPVTSRVAREAGRGIWGYPKFVADMSFDISPEYQEVTLSEDGRTILSLSVRRAGAVALERAPLTTFTVLDGRLIQTVIPTRGYVATAVGSRGGELELGDHPVAHDLAALGLHTKPFLTRTHLTHTAILPRGKDIGAADRHYGGYSGGEREVGDHTVRYDDETVRVISASARDDRVALGV